MYFGKFCEPINKRRSLKNCDRRNQEIYFTGFSLFSLTIYNL